jgi:inorganic phosphate transporter, PiT family
MLSFLAQGSPAAIGFLMVCLVLVLAFEFSNGFHDTANAVATVIYTKSLRPLYAVVWSGIMNFTGVIFGGIAVAYALVELIPPEVLSPPNGGVAVGMLAALFVSALIWNVGTWWFGIPNSSSHALIGALVGIAVANSIFRGRGFGNGVDWDQVWSVLSSLLLSPIIGFALALILFRLLKLVIHDKRLYEPPEGDKPPVWWMRALLILTCTAVSFAHGTNDGQKSIGLIMLVIIGLLPTSFAVNLDMKENEIAKIVQNMPIAASLIERYGDDDEKSVGSAAARKLAATFAGIHAVSEIPEAERPAVRNDLNQVLSGLKTASQAKGISPDDKERAKAIHKLMMESVQYAPWWVRVLSALCLGFGTMIGYKRIVTTLGERLGKEKLAPAQGASAELSAASVIGVAGFTGFPVSTTHVVTGGISGTMVGSRAGLQMATVWQIAAAWVLTLPATIVLSGILFYLLS